MPLPLDATTGLGDLPPWDWTSTVFTEWGVNPWLFVLTVWVAGLYLIGVWTLHQRGDRWPLARTIGTLIAGTIPFLSFFVEHKRTRQVKADFGV